MLVLLAKIGISGLFYSGFAERDFTKSFFGHSSMADWEGLIAKLKSEQKQKEEELEPVAIEANQSFEFGDLLESSIQKKVSEALSKAEMNPLKIGPIAKKEKQETSGENWFNVPKARLSEEDKRDWQLLRMRSVLSHGGAGGVELSEEPPEFVQFGVIKDNPIEGNKNRVSKKYRAPTIAESLAKDAEFRDFIETNIKKLNRD